MRSSGPSNPRQPRNRRTKRGVAMTEYVVLVGTVSLVSVGAFIALGVAFVNALAFDRTFLLSPFP